MSTLQVKSDVSKKGMQSTHHTIQIGAKFKKDEVYFAKPAIDANGEKIPYSVTHYSGEEDGKKWSRDVDEVFLDCGGLSIQTMKRIAYDADDNAVHAEGQVANFANENFINNQTMVDEFFDKFLHRMGTKGIICTNVRTVRNFSGREQILYDFDFVESGDEYKKRCEKENKKAEKQAE